MKNVLILILALSASCITAQEKPVFAKKVVVDKDDAYKLKALKNLGVCRIENRNTLIPNPGMSIILKDSKIIVFPSSYGTKKDAPGKYLELLDLIKEGKENPFGEGGLEGTTLGKEDGLTSVVCSSTDPKCGCSWVPDSGYPNRKVCEGCSSCKTTAMTSPTKINSYTDNQNRVRSL